MNLRTEHLRSAEDGLGIVEVLVGLVLISIVSIGVTLSLVVSMKTYKRAEYNLAAANFAGSKIENLAAISPSELDSDDDSTETGLFDAATNLLCERVTEVTRTANVVDVMVTMNCQNAASGDDDVETFSYSSTFVDWGG